MTVPLVSFIDQTAAGAGAANAGAAMTPTPTAAMTKARSSFIGSISLPVVASRRFVGSVC